MTRAPWCAGGELRASRIGASIRALSDLCFGIISGASGGSGPSLPSGLLLQLLKAPARPGLSLTLCASAGTEPGGKVRRWSVGHDLPPRGSWQAPARRLTHGPSPLKALARPGLSFIPKLECWRKAALTATSLVKVLTCYASSLLSSSPTKDSSRASNIQCSATFSYALFMKGSVACAARCLASSAFRRQASRCDDIRGPSSNAPNQAASRCVGSGGHDRPPSRSSPSPGPFVTAAGQGR